MKKLLLILLFTYKVDIIFAQRFSDYKRYLTEKKQTSAPELSLDPRSNRFCMYFNPLLDIESITTNERDVYKVFDKNELMRLDCLDRGYIWFSVHERYYKLWIPEDSLLFTVKLPKNCNKPLGYHLLLFIDVLRSHYMNKQKCIAKIN